MFLDSFSSAKQYMSFLHSPFFSYSFLPFSFLPAFLPFLCFILELFLFNFKNYCKVSYDEWFKNQNHISYIPGAYDCGIPVTVRWNSSEALLDSSHYILIRSTKSHLTSVFSQGFWHYSEVSNFINYFPLKGSIIKDCYTEVQSFMRKHSVHCKI